MISANRAEAPNSDKSILFCDCNIVCVASVAACVAALADVAKKAN